MLTSISNGILALHREHYGRGADRARTIAHGDYLVTFLHDIFTPGERTLVEAGKFAQVRDMRTAWQDTMRPQFTKVVEEATGRKVLAFFSQVDEKPAMAIEGFALEPQPATS